MTPEEKRVIEAGIAWHQSHAAYLAPKDMYQGALFSAIGKLMDSRNVDTLDMVVVDPADLKFTLKVPYPCPDCLADDEDPAPWCDCRNDERCRIGTPCRKRAHDPNRCDNRPTCGAGSTEDIWKQCVHEPHGPEVKHSWETCGATSSDKISGYPPCTFEPHGPETIHSWEENWVITCWRYVRDWDRVRLGGHEATVETTSLNDWHVDPNSNPRYPKAWQHSECTVRLSGRDPLTFDPVGQVEILMDAERQAIHNLMALGAVQVINE